MRRCIACALMLVVVISWYKLCHSGGSGSVVPEPVLAHPGAPLLPPASENEELAAQSDPPSEPPQSEAQKLANQLTQGAILERQDAAFALAALGPDAEEAVPALVAALDSVSLREPATQALLAVGPRGWHALLSHPIGDWVRERVRRAANPNGEALCALGEAANERWEALVPLPRLEEYKVGLGFSSPRPGLVRVSPVTLPFLIRALRNTDPAARMLAAERLEQLGPLARPAIDSLITVLEDPWPLQAPAQFGGGYALVRGASYSVRIAAVKALLAIGPAGQEALVREGVPRLVAGLQTDNFDVQIHTVRALALIGPTALPAAPRLAQELRQRLVSGTLRNLEGFSEALVAMGPEVVPALVPLLADSDDLVRMVALGIISNLGSRARAHVSLVRGILHKSKGPSRSDAARVLARIAPDDPATVETLVDAVKYDGCRGAIEALGQLGPRARAAVPALKALLGAEGSDDWETLRALKEIGLSWTEVPDRIRAIDPDRIGSLWLRTDGQGEPTLCGLIERLETAGEVTRRLEYAEQLCRFDPEFAKYAMPVVIEFLERHPEVRSERYYASLIETSLRVLEQAGPAAADVLPILVKRRSDPKWQEESLPCATPFLARVAPTDPEVVPALMALLAYPDREDRRRAAEELGRLGPAARRAIPRMERALSDEAAEVRMFASAALIRITGDHDRHAPRLRQAVRDTPSAAYAIATLGADWPWTVAALRDALRHPAGTINQDELWGRYHGSLSAAVLVQHAAARCLAQIGASARSAVPDLIRILHEESQRLPSLCAYDLVVECATTLGTFGPEARAALPVLYYFDPNHPLSRGPVHEAIDRIEGRSR
jgi:HEAT repeat protein